MKRSFLRGGLILVLIMMLLSCGKIYKKGDMRLKIVKAKWEEIFLGDEKTTDKYLVVALNIYLSNSNDRPNLPMSVKDESGESYPQGSNKYTYYGSRVYVDTLFFVTKTNVDTCFLVTKTNKKLYLIAGDFDPIPISPK